MLSDIINDHISEERLKELELEEVKSMFIFLDIYVISLVMKLLYNNKCPIVCLIRFWGKVIFSPPIHDNCLTF